VRLLRVYADTSVYGGVYDPEFAEPSKAFFELVRQGVYRLVISTSVRDEIEKAPEPVRLLLTELAPRSERIEISLDAVELQEAYLRARIVSEQSRADALHVALASVSGCSLIVIWNFKHIVNFRRIPLYNGVNLSNGYGMVTICSPLEVIEDEEAF